MVQPYYLSITADSMPGVNGNCRFSVVSTATFFDTMAGQQERAQPVNSTASAIPQKFPLEAFEGPT